MAQHLYGIKQYYLQNYLPQTPLDPHFKGESFSSEELQSFQEIASLFVEDCKIRE
jgi:hypothetical protein